MRPYPRRRGAAAAASFTDAPRSSSSEEAYSTLGPWAETISTPCSRHSRTTSAACWLLPKSKCLGERIPHTSILVIPAARMAAISRAPRGVSSERKAPVVAPNLSAISSAVYGSLPTVCCS